ncbi:hypothetical protein TrVFT333_010290 [Trichoderma virens FT-333]|nr:hypothetical protein TrVFT333_010290 [Trichoderma virens FT-333]
MSEEPSLPRLPAVSWDEQSQSFSNQPRKRHRSSRAGNPSSPLNFNSSDPAVFSSDDDPGLDNYVEGRNKRRYVGSWFQQQLETADDATPAPIQTKRFLKRDFDSGVFLGSDATDGEDLMDGLELPALPKLPQLGTRAVPRLSQAEIDALRKIQDCLESGNEAIDLWSMGLEELSDDIVHRMSQIACIPVVARDVAFVQKEPELKLFLSLNRLTRLPSSLFDINHLTVLSLRGNQLTELPSAISKLRNLKQLNISQNRFRHLPAEFLDLFKVGGNFRELSLFVNPFLQPEQPAPSVEDDGQRLFQPTPYETRTYKWIFDHDTVPRYLTRWLGRSPLQISDSNGQILSEFRLPSGEEFAEIHVPVAVSSDQFGLSVSYSPRSSKEEARPSVVPSLVELALQSCYRASQLRELDSYIPEGLSHLKTLLQRASWQKDNGELICSTCRKTLIVPRLEWIEWREICRGTIFTSVEYNTTEMVTRPFTKDEKEMAVPFLYRACSWRCGPKDSEKNKGWSLPNPESVEEAGPGAVQV